MRCNCRHVATSAAGGQAPAFRAALPGNEQQVVWSVEIVAARPLLLTLQEQRRDFPSVETRSLLHCARNNGVAVGGGTGNTSSTSNVPFYYSLSGA